MKEKECAERRPNNESDDAMCVKNNIIVCEGKGNGTVAWAIHTF
jgi:hypothetical protein